MNKILATYNFGSKVAGYDTPSSDTDVGEVRYYGLASFISLNPSKRNTPKNSTEKTKTGDKEILDYANFLQQVMNPNPNLHAKIMTLTPTSDHFWVTDYRYVLDEFIYWRSYIYRCISFVDNLPNTIKGTVQAIYTLSLVLNQIDNNIYCVDPKWWHFDSSTLIYKCVSDRNSLTDNGDDDKNFITYWQTQVSLVKEILNKSPKLDAEDVRYNERENFLLDILEMFITLENR